MANKFFQPNPLVFGGTEYMASLFQQHVKVHADILLAYHCFLLPGYLPPIADLLKDDKEIIIWLHNPFNQFDSQLLFDLSHPDIKKRIKAVVVVSNYLKASVLSELSIEKEKVFVIPNVVAPIENDLSRFRDVRKVKAIYTSSADRGLDVLFDALPLISEEFELAVFSNYYPDFAAEIAPIDSRVTFYGSTPRSTVIKYLSQSHIFAYPCTFNETFCLSLGEAISANCLPVYRDQAALIEIGSRCGMVYSADTNNHAQVFAEQMSEAIQRVKSNAYDPVNSAQRIREKYALPLFIDKWIELFDKLT